VLVKRRVFAAASSSIVNAAAILFAAGGGSVRAGSGHAAHQVDMWIFELLNAVADDTRGKARFAAQ